MSKNIKNFLLQPAHFRLDGGAMYGIIPRPLWSKYSPPDELNRIDLALRLWLIQTDHKVILIDTGIGDYHGDKFDQRFDVRGPESPLEKALKKINLTPEDITDVIISHLHFDHVGGLCKMSDQVLVPIFKKAHLHLHEEHLQYALNPTLRDAGSFHHRDFGPIVDYYKEKNHLVLHRGEEGDLFPIDEKNTLRFMCSHGHTPFLMHPFSNDYIYLADLIPTSNHINIPWVMGYDIAPGVTTVDKIKFLDFIHQNNLNIIFEHDPDFYGSTISKNDKGQFIAKNKIESQKIEAHQIHIT